MNFAVLPGSPLHHHQFLPWDSIRAYHAQALYNYSSKGETAVQNTRIFSLLESLGLEDRIYHPEKAPWPDN